MDIHLIAPKDKSQWRDKWKKCYKFWENSSYNVIIWDDEKIDNILKQDDIMLFEVLNQLPPIYKYDYVRYIILDKFGGAYFDLDVEVIVDFIPSLHPDEVYISEGQPFKDEEIKRDFGDKLSPSFFELIETPIDYALSNHIMISPKNRGLWKIIKNKVKINLIKYYKTHNGNFINVLKVVGPIALSRIVFEYGFHHKLLSYHHFDVGDDDRSAFVVCKHHKTFNWVKEEK
tara:strand:+ start:80 stop:769 length:690 start_codon:yes stop_codon:yes gene_type:complete